MEATAQTPRIGTPIQNKDRNMISGKPFKFFNVMPFSPGKEKQVAKDMIALRDRTGIDTLLYELTLHPEGFPASKKRDILIESFRQLKHELDGSGIQMGVLVQSILGHWPRTDKDEETWTRTVDIQGRTVRYCPMDEQFRKYIFDTIVLLAKEHPTLILGDDDIRSFSPDAECFCPLHTAEFNRRTGHCFTSEEYRKAVLASHSGDEVFTNYEKLRRETTDGVAKLIREAIDSVDPSIKAGTCMSCWEIPFNGTTSLAIAGKNPAVMRVANGMYFENTIRTLPSNILLTQLMRLYYAEIPYLLDEADTFPQNRYSKSARTMHAKLTSSIFSGLNGAKLWYVNAHRYGNPISRKYTDILAEYAGYYQTLAREIQGTDLQGIIIPGDKFLHKWHPATPFAAEKLRPEKTWADKILGQFGIPFKPSFEMEKDGIYALAGTDSIQRLSDSDLIKLFGHRLLIDGPAAVELTKRGFAKYMGVEAEQKDFCYNQELFSKTRNSLPTMKHPSVPFLRVINPSVKIVTQLFYSPFTGSPNQEEVAPATVFFINVFGGRICTTTFNDAVLYNLDEIRKKWLLDTLDWLNGKKIPYVFEEDQPVTMLHRVVSDKMDILALFNLGFDRVDPVSIRCAERPAKVECLMPSGEFETLVFEWADNIITLPVRLECAECLILRISR